MTNRFLASILTLCTSLLLTSHLSIAATQKTVLITGANRGLGLELTKHFVNDGYHVIGTARKPDKATELKTTKAEIIQLDVTSDQSIASMANSLKGRTIDILINNAGYFGPKLMTEKPATLKDLTKKEMQDCLAVNTLGPIFVTQALLPNLQKSSQPIVVNMSTRASILTHKTGGNAYGYKVSKTALNMVTRTMAADPSLRGAIVISLAPGHNKTDMGTHWANLDPTQSMAKVKTLITSLTPKHHGGFWFFDGSPRPW
ncbi:SDR family oxidoreductase [Rubritalea tangerina]|uniref:SDR family oxidoreductase n=2 Tax=Rubritalea tangerina TaxID=430798 RepID=A0ABW4Z5P6_9BACT